jgi:hypothetical protein
LHKQQENSILVTIKKKNMSFKQTARLITKSGFKKLKLLNIFYNFKKIVGFKETVRF